MPVFRSEAGSRTDSAAIVDRLTSELKQELAINAGADHPFRQPIILERELADGSLHVTVIWEKWRLIRPREQGGVIYAAYRAVAPERAENITIAVPATVWEAFRLGLLPFEVKPRAEADPTTLRRFQDAMRTEGAAETPNGPHLLFPDRRSAEAALRRLRQETSSDDWGVLEYVQPGEDGMPE